MKTLRQPQAITAWIIISNYFWDFKGWKDVMQAALPHEVHDHPAMIDFDY